VAAAAAAQGAARVDAFDFDETAVVTHHIGAMDTVCEFCEARYFPGEFGRGMNACCMGGKILLPKLPALPSELLQLYVAHDAVSRHFRKGTRTFNNAYAFASLQCPGLSREDAGSNRAHNVVAGAGHGPPVFRISGQMHHVIGPLLAPSLPNGRPDPAQANFTSVYFLDEAKDSRDRRLAGAHIAGVQHDRVIMDIMEAAMTQNVFLQGPHNNLNNLNNSNNQNNPHNPRNQQNINNPISIS
jgi:hypothetical protein